MDSIYCHVQYCNIQSADDMAMGTRCFCDKISCEDVVICTGAWCLAGVRGNEGFVLETDEIW